MQLYLKRGVRKILESCHRDEAAGPSCPASKKFNFESEHSS